MFFAALALSVAVQTSANGLAANPFGVWRTPVDEGLIRIERCGDDLCGRVAGSAPLDVRPDQTDIRNHDPALRNRPIMGLLMMKLKPLGPGRWGDGWIYNAKDGGTYQAKLEIAADGSLHFTGCLAPLLCKTQTWIRAG